ncbi:MAG: single-stranded-DNA-specific exonuclease RecJ [Firmicutes bacterium]|nr:single-stranded-DNA-specific exonuclease RecJ [Bacillota bacterium]
MRNGNATWLLRTSDPLKETALVDALGISSTVARILVGRGIDTPRLATEFFDLRWDALPSPWMLADMRPAIERLAKAIKEGELVTIYGDYDVDGMTATALLVRVILALGGQADYYIPRRADEGYGLHQEALAEILPHSSLVVTVDCGITAIDEAMFAKESGLDLIITDHHQPCGELPSALAVINPNRSDCPYPYKELAGVGVALKLAHALALSMLGSAENADALVGRHLDLVALGTVADVVPLRGENRILVHLGLEAFARESVGLQALLKVAGLDDGRDLSATNLAFGLAPRLNALGRLDDASTGVRLLLSEDPDEARGLAKMLDEANQERRAIERAITEEAMARVEAELDMDEEWAIVLASPDWHPGVIGIVASRLVEKYHRPTILISLQDELGKGSGRSIEGFDMHKALESLSHLLERFGGHKMAAGLSIRAPLVEELRKELNQLARMHLREEDLVPKLSLDADVALCEINHALLEELQSLAPYGAGNPEPVLMVQDVILERSYLVGKGQDHLKLLVSGTDVAGASSDSFEAIGFRMGDQLDLVEGAKRVDLAFRPKINEWNGRVSIDLQLRDVRLPNREFVQQYLCRSLADYKELGVGQGRMIWENAKGCQGPIAAPAHVIDWRMAEDRTKQLRKVLQSPGPTLLYVAWPSHVWSLAEELTDQGPLRGRVGIFSNQLVETNGGLLEELLRRRALDLVITTEPLGEDLACYFPKIVLYHLPLTPKEFRYMWNLAPQEIYLAYRPTDFELVRRLWPKLYPGWDELARLYLYLSQSGALDVPIEVSGRVLQEARVGLDWVGFCRASRIFQELDLVSIEGSSKWQEAGSTMVRLLPSPENKLDLTSSISYNDCVKCRDSLARYGQWALEVSVAQLKGQGARDKMVL